MMRLTPLPAFQDNDLWFLHDGRRSRGVDPGNAQPVLEGLQREGLQLEAILVTRHHPDHAGGVDALGDEKFAALPREARDCCTHEYTLSNLRFAPAAEPGNLQLINFSKRCKERLRTRDEAVAQAARGHDAATAPDEGGCLRHPPAMEQRIQMKLSPLGLLILLLALAGCGSVTTQPAPVDTLAGPAKAQAPAPAASSATANLAPVIPSGDLKPIASVDVKSSNVALLVPPADLWERIRRGFKMPDLQDEYVRQQEQWYLQRPDYIARMTERSRKYLFHIVEELERRDMPTELALLPFVESAFNPQAVSTARAAGMWQFIPSTGRVFDLKQNVFRDDRRDVLASTRAALDYLQKLHDMFGDWQLALAAYNWGEGSVQRAIARNQRLGLGTTYAELSMPAETRSYVPKLQALKNIIGNPEAYNAELPVIGNHPYFQTVTITHDIDVKLAADLADVPLDDFKALNPSMNRPVILANGTGQILLPWDNAAIFQRNFEAYNAGQYASWTAWKVPVNMSAHEAAKRTGMSEADLRAVNTIPPRMLIKAGSVLIVPRSAKNQEDVSDEIADNAQLNLQSELVTRKMMVKAGKKDSVASIARRYRVSAKQVAEWNETAVAAKFHPGQQVVVYVPVRTSSHAMKHHTSRAVAHKGTAKKTHAVAAKKPTTKTANR